MTNRAFVLVALAGLSGSVFGQTAIQVEQTEVSLNGEGFGFDSSVRLVDINGDGFLDMVRGTFTEYRLGAADGSFGPVQSGVSCRALGDVDNDGDLDCIVSGAEWSIDGEDVRADMLWRERTDEGEYLDAVSLALPSTRRADGDTLDEEGYAYFLVADLNGDGFSDVVRTVSDRDTYQSVVEYVVRGDGFGPAVVSDRFDFNVYNGASASVGPDFDGDGFPSLRIDDFDNGEYGGETSDYYINTEAGFGSPVLEVQTSSFDQFYAAQSLVLLDAADDGAPVAVFITGFVSGGPSTSPEIGSVKQLVEFPGGAEYEPVGVVEIVQGLPDNLAFVLGVPHAEIQDRTGRGFDPDGDGDQDLLIEVLYGFTLNATVRETVVFYNEGDMNFRGSLGQQVRYEFGDGGDERGFVCAEGLDLVGSRLEDLDRDGIDEHVSGVPGPGVQLSKLDLITTADLDFDGRVSSHDLAILLASWGQPGSAADISCDGTTGVEDLVLLLAGWGLTE